MPVLINGKFEREQEYENEDELQKYLFEKPYLLQNESDAKYFAVKREIYLPSAGRLDLFLIDEHGTPIAVEVKLDRNSQSKREVVAQVIDYISDISYMNYHSLDELTDGKLEDVINNIDNENKLPKIVNSSINSGSIKMIIAVDHANNDLKRIMLFLKERTNFDVRLVEISKYNNGESLFPIIIVDTHNLNLIKSNITKTKQNSNNDRNEIFENVISIYNSKIDYELKTRTESKDYRQIRPSNWLSVIHYEFRDRKKSNSIGIEFHIEENRYSNLQDTIKNFEGKLVKGYKILFDQKWANNKGRIYFEVPTINNAEDIAESMIEFIRLTKEDIDRNVKYKI